MDARDDAVHCLCQLPGVIILDDLRGKACLSYETILTETPAEIVGLLPPGDGEETPDADTMEQAVTDFPLRFP